MNKDLQDVVAALQAHLSNATVVQGYKYPVSAITCRDGTRFSVQASDFTYCKPRNNTGPWTHVEVMTLTDDVVEMPAAKKRGRPAKTETAEDSPGAAGISTTAGRPEFGKDMS